MSARIPASMEQRDIWLALQHEGESGRYNVPLFLDFQGTVDTAALEFALADVTARHEALRSRFELTGGELRQVVDSPSAVQLTVHPSAVSQGRDAAFAASVRAAARPMNPSARKMLRADLFPYSGGQILCLVTHHIVADRWSLEVIARHIVRAYGRRLEGQVADLGTTPSSIDVPADHSGHDVGIRYWNEQLAGDWRWLVPASDLAPGNSPDTVPASHEVVMPASAVKLLRVQLEQRGLSPVSAVMAGWALLLHAWSGFADGLIGMPFSGRNMPSTHDEVGLFTRVLPIRTQFAPEVSFSEFAESVRDRVLTSLEFSEIPVDTLRSLRNATGENPFAPEVVLTPYTRVVDLGKVGEAVVELLEDPADLADYRLALVVREDAGQIALRLDYDSMTYRTGTAQLLLRQLSALLCAVSERFESGCGALIAELDDSAVRDAVLEDRRAAGDRPEPSLPDLVVAQAERRPDAVAVAHETAALTYRELVERAAAGADLLRSHGVGPGDAVAVRLAAGAEAVVAVLAVAFAGAAYLCFEPDETAIRGQKLEAKLIIEQGSREGRHAEGAPAVLESIYQPANSIAIRSDRSTPTVSSDQHLVVRTRTTSDGMAGTEAFDHRGLTALVATGGFFHLDESNSVLQVAPPGSMGAVYEIWGALTQGACLIPTGGRAATLAESLRHELGRARAAVLLLTTEQFHDLAEHAPDELQGARQVRVFGEPPSVASVHRAVRWCGYGVLRYGYAPQNGALVSTDLRLERLADGAAVVPLGGATAGMSVDVLSANGVDTTPPGVVGHVWMAGPVLARVVGSCAGMGEAMRITGVQARRNAAGELELVPKPEATSPRTAVGLEHDAPSQPQAPQLVEALSRVGALDSVLAAWGAVLPTPVEGADRNFFDAGGNSLLVIKLQEELRAHTGVTISIADLFRNTTARAQAALIEAIDAGKRQDAPSESQATEPVAEPGARRDDDIAVIGIGCRFAGAPDKDTFWRNLIEGKSWITTSPQPETGEFRNGARRVPRWGLIADGVGYDAQMLGFSPDELAAADPQHGVLYESLWAAVEDAALKISEIGPRTSLYVGADRSNERPDWGTVEAPVRSDDVISSSATFIATRFAYWNDLWGEAVVLDSGCSTSLLAVHLACASLRRGDVDYALAGGVSIENPADGGYTYTPGHLYSADGFCRPFDANASGTVGGDGSGAVLLRRLSDAVRDGDPIYAVIRGSAVNNDGIARVGYSAPGVEGQARVIRRALAAAGLTGDQIDYVEPHGTGTRLGDAIEAIALSEALGPDGPQVAVGGLKASIGHTNTAAGVAGLIKAALSVSHGFLPGTPLVSEPIGELENNGGRLRLLPEGMPWPDNDRPRTAGVSSFGVGGTNAHVVIQEFHGGDRGQMRGV